MTNNKNLGNKGEILAKEYLLHHGYKIITNNYHFNHLEIDLIAQQQGYTVFVEVKTRIKTPESLNENPLAKWQTKNLKRAIDEYCFNNHIDLEKIRLDLIVVLVDTSRQTATLKHYQDIF
ncbi:MAG: YraN family protein [Patescibacteria group bacterium]|jgi:putative endonuclease